MGKGQHVTSIKALRSEKVALRTERGEELTSQLENCSCRLSITPGPRLCWGWGTGFWNCMLISVPAFPSHASGLLRLQKRCYRSV